jgi:NAD(P)H-dependent FMN reductase
MKILAISGSTRQKATNTALLMAIKAASPNDIAITVFDGIGSLPVFSPDLEGPNLPESVQDFMRLIA